MVHINGDKVSSCFACLVVPCLAGVVIGVAVGVLPHAAGVAGTLEARCLGSQGWGERPAVRSVLS